MGRLIPRSGAVFFLRLEMKGRRDCYALQWVLLLQRTPDPRHLIFGLSQF